MLITSFLGAFGGGGGVATATSPAGGNVPATPLAQGNPSTVQASVGGMDGAPAALGPAARFNSPDGIAVAPNGDLLVVDAGNATIRRVTPAGAVSTVAGSPGVTGNADGVGSAASFNEPSGIAVDRAGNLYVADTGNHTIRRIAPDGATVTLAGTAGTPGSADGDGAAARFNRPSGVTADAAGNVYVADTQNYAIRKIAPNGAVGTLAGVKGVRGTADGSGAAAGFLGPRGIAADGAGNLYVTDIFFIPSPILSRDMTTVRRIAPDGSVATLAGQPNSAGGRTDADGIGRDARFLNASGITVDAGGSMVFVADSGNQLIRRMTTADNAVTRYNVAVANGTEARFAYPRGIALAPDGTLYVADTGNHVIRRIAPDGTSSILAGREGEQGSNDRGAVDPS